MQPLNKSTLGGSPMINGSFCFEGVQFAMYCRIPMFTGYIIPTSDEES